MQSHLRGQLASSRSWGKSLFLETTSLQTSSRLGSLRSAVKSRSSIAGSDFSLHLSEEICWHRPITSMTRLWSMRGEPSPVLSSLIIEIFLTRGPRNPRSASRKSKNERKLLSSERTISWRKSCVVANPCKPRHVCESTARSRKPRSREISDQTSKGNVNLRASGRICVKGVGSRPRQEGEVWRCLDM